LSKSDANGLPIFPGKYCGCPAKLLHFATTRSHSAKISEKDANYAPQNYEASGKTI